MDSGHFLHGPGLSAGFLLFFGVGLRVWVLGLEQFRVEGLGVAGLGLRAQG